MSRLWEDMRIEDVATDDGFDEWKERRAGMLDVTFDKTTRLTIDGGDRVITDALNSVVFAEVYFRNGRLEDKWGHVYENDGGNGEKIIVLATDPVYREFVLNG